MDLFTRLAWTVVVKCEKYPYFDLTSDTCWLMHVFHACLMFLEHDLVGVLLVWKQQSHINVEQRMCLLHKQLRQISKSQQWKQHHEIQENTWMDILIQTSQKMRFDPSKNNWQTRNMRWPALGSCWVFEILHPKQQSVSLICSTSK